MIKAMSKKDIDWKKRKSILMLGFKKAIDIALEKEDYEMLIMIEGVVNLFKDRK